MRAAAAGIPLKLFLSYGRQDAADAEAVRDRLTERGHEVWFDTQRLETGVDWETGIEAGLKDCDKVVLLMTPHAVRQRIPGDPTSSDGFCLNEIAKAQQLHKTIIPVMLKDVPGGPPTSICRVQWLDMTGCPPSTSGDLPRYRALFDRLLAAIERDELDFEGGQSRLIDLLRPLDYSVEFSKHIGRFCGRAWLVDKVDRWLSSDDASRVLWMLGKPGLGKTAFAAYLCHKLASAWHVCVHDHEDKSDPRRAVLSIAYQLATSLPEYHTRLVNKVTAEDVQKAAPTLFDDLILAPLTVGEFPDPGRTHLVVIDAIDEASRRSGDDFAQLIANRARQLPRWLRLVVTSRPDPELEEAIRDREPYVETFEIEADGASNRADLRAYVDRELEALGHRVGDAVVDAVVERSEGIFLYASRVIQSLRDGLLSVDRLTELPKGMRSWYRDEFQRRFTDADAYERDLVPVLNLIIAQRAPLPVPLIQDALELKRRDLDRRLRALGSLFEIGMSGSGESSFPVIMPAHKTLSEWLGEIDPRTRRAAAGRFSVDVDEGHECLADHGWGLYESKTLGSSPYCRRFLPEHLLMAQRHERVRDLLCDLELFDRDWAGERRFDAMRYWRAVSDKFDPAASYLEALDRFAESGAPEKDHARLASRIGAFLLEMGLPREAMSLIKRAVELRSTTTGADRLDLAESLQHLADAYRDQGLFDEAHPLYTQALEILEEE
ncbi:MAG: TIR domain-containing protein, partial [Acidobacteriota bacterium]|nr:TIR domain-containing protein [Acidobacteriota bacterium]